MEYVVYGVDAVGADEQLEALAEDHWRYLDQYSERVVARGPTLSPDGASHTGSIHVVGSRPARRRTSVRA